LIRCVASDRQARNKNNNAHRQMEGDDFIPHNMRLFMDVIKFVKQKILILSQKIGREERDILLLLENAVSL
jgi:hypothetical protein